MKGSVEKRQAVVLIHGIGEQHPIVTLRNFVESVADYYIKIKKLARNDEVIFWDKPDPDSGNYETRKMTMRQGRTHPTTDFYEFYWARHMRDTNWSHIQDWFQRVVFRMPGKISKRLLPIFLSMWLLFLAIVVLFAAYTYKNGFSNVSEKLISISSGLIATVILGYFTKLLFNYLGDAARYLDPSPQNIDERQKIRAEGIALLKKLHDSGKYDRIIIVGHSLGSAIAYDLVKFLWNEYYSSFKPDKFYETFIGENKSVLDNIELFETVSKKMKAGEAGIEDLRKAQEGSFEYLQAIGNNWLVTDLLTIGSPLSYAGHLFVYQDSLFEKLKEQREYPTCPPRFQKPDTSNVIVSRAFNIPGVQHPFNCKHFNHSSPFSATKWTNIYYDSDYIGGPMQNVFGKGIKDIRIERPGFIPFYPGGHTQYWNPDERTNILKEIWEVLEIKKQKSRS